ncbi:hypothetical protein [Propionivibrio sp.]|uniref:hypothetical protein n=1 Tax=Propionivibrio sp. TaxID=2212460 RepID=UPI003BF4109F
MSTITFDTHQLVKELKANGFSDDQAEGINDALKNALNVADVATRRGLKALELNLTIKIGVLIVAALGFMTAIQKML